MAFFLVAHADVDYGLEDVWDAEVGPLRQFDPDSLGMALVVEQLLDCVDHGVVRLTGEYLEWKFRFVHCVFGFAFVEHLGIVDCQRR